MMKDLYHIPIIILLCSSSSSPSLKWRRITPYVSWSLSSLNTNSSVIPLTRSGEKPLPLKNRDFPGFVVCMERSSRIIIISQPLLSSHHMPRTPPILIKSRRSSMSWPVGLVNHDACVSDPTLDDIAIPNRKLISISSIAPLNPQAKDNYIEHWRGVMYDEGTNDLQNRMKERDLKR